MTTITVASSYDGKSERDRLIEADQMLSKYNAGMSAIALGEEYGINRTTVYRRIQKALDARLAPTVDEYRETQNAILDEQIQRALKVVSMGEEMCKSALAAENLPMAEKGLEFYIKGFEMVMKVTESRRRLNGLDMPVKVDAVVVHHDARDLELAQMVAEKKTQVHDHVG